MAARVLLGVVAAAAAAAAAAAGGTTGSGSTGTGVRGAVRTGAPRVVRNAPSDYPACDDTTEGGAACAAPVAGVIPTQPLVGMLEVQCKVARYEAMSGSDLDAYLVKNPVTGYIGPAGAVYLVDGHHQARALADADVAAKHKVLLVNIKDNFSNCTTLASFWSIMANLDELWLYDERGRQPINPNMLPATLERLVNWPYRSLAWAVRNNGGYAKTSQSFADFLWGEYFANNSLLAPPATTVPFNPVTSWTFCDAAPYDLTCYPQQAADIARVLGDALALAAAPAAAGLPGAGAGVIDLPNCGNVTEAV